MLVPDQLYCVSEMYYKMAGGKSDSAIQPEKTWSFISVVSLRLEHTRASCGPQNFVSLQAQESVFKFVF